MRTRLNLRWSVLQKQEGEFECALQLGFSYIVGHEIFHSFITEALQNRSEEYKKETECIIQHYNQSCTLFAEVGLYIVW